MYSHIEYFVNFLSNLFYFENPAISKHFTGTYHAFVKYMKD